MKQAHKQASEENLRLNVSNYCVFLFERRGKPTQVAHLYLNFFPSFDLLQFPVSLFCTSRTCVGKWTGTTGFHSNSGLLSWSHSSHLPSQGLPSFPNSCRRTPCQDPTTADQSLANSVFGASAALLNKRVCQHPSLILSLFYFLFLPFSTANKPPPNSYLLSFIN